VFDEIKAGIKSSLGQTQVHFSSICPRGKKDICFIVLGPVISWSIIKRSKESRLVKERPRIKIRKPNVFEHLHLRLEIVASNQILFSNNDTRREHYTTLTSLNEIRCEGNHNYIARRRYTS